MIEEINNKYEWEGFLAQCEEKSFLQSWNWGEFIKTTGGGIWRVGIYENNELLAVCLVIKRKAKRGTYLLVEHGVVVKSQTSNGKHQIIKELLSYLKNLAKQEKASFIRVCPIWKKTETNEKIFRNLGFRNAPMHEHPEISLVLALDKPEEELLMKMRKTTRYLIRQALKNRDIEIIKSQELKDVDIFNNLYQKTVERHRFSPFSLEYLKNEFLTFINDNQILIFLGKYRDEVIARAMIIFWQDRAFYHQGASSRKYAKIPANYLLQWEALKEAKKRGIKYYSFWGIAPENKANHPWRGLTSFKKGFGGNKKEYVKTQDFVISKKYWLNYIIELLRKMKRGF